MNSFGNSVQNNHIGDVNISGDLDVSGTITASSTSYSTVTVENIQASGTSGITILDSSSSTISTFTSAGLDMNNHNITSAKRIECKDLVSPVINSEEDITATKPTAGKFQMLFPYADQPYLSTDYGASFSAVGSVQNWVDSVVTRDGQTTYAVTSPSSKFYAITNGTGFAQSGLFPVLAVCGSICASNDGKIVYASEYITSGNIYRSTDSGINWTLVQSSLAYPYRLACSYDGSFVVCSTNDSKTLDFYVSSDYFNTKSTVLSPVEQIISVAISADGKYGVIANSTPATQSYYTNDYFTTFTGTGYGGYCKKAVMSASGRYAYLLQGYNGGLNPDNVIFSENYGQTFTAATGFPVKDWYSGQCTVNGKQCYAVEYKGTIAYKTSYYGTSQTTTGAIPNVNWLSYSINTGLNYHTGIDVFSSGNIHASEILTCNKLYAGAQTKTLAPNAQINLDSSNSIISCNPEFKIGINNNETNQLITSGFGALIHYDGIGNGRYYQGTISGSPSGSSNLRENLRLNNGGSVICNPASLLATSATGGFFYLPAMSGTPTGVPGGYTGSIPFVIDIAPTVPRLFCYNGTRWQDTMVGFNGGFISHDVGFNLTPAAGVFAPLTGTAPNYQVFRDMKQVNNSEMQMQVTASWYMFHGELSISTTAPDIISVRLYQGTVSTLLPPLALGYSAVNLPHVMSITHVYHCTSSGQNIGLSVSSASGVTMTIHSYQFSGTYLTSF